MKLQLHWNAGRNSHGGRTVKNLMFGASWAHYGNWPERATQLYLGPWVLTLTVPTSRPGTIRTDL